MAQTGYTPILLYATPTASAVPSAANLTSTATGAELAINYTDGKLYYKDNTGTVQLLASKGALITASFSIKESGGKLYFYYGSTAIASMDSSGNIIALGNVTASGTP